MGVIKDFYFSDIKPSERYVKRESEYYKLSVKLSDDIDEFMGLLSDKENQLFEKIIDSIYYINSISEEECFTNGFCIGVKMMVEVINYKSENFE